MISVITRCADDTKQITDMIFGWICYHTKVSVKKNIEVYLAKLSQSPKLYVD